MPPARRQARTNQPAHTQCTDPRCVSMRQSYGQMCAARGIAQRRVDRLEAELGLRNARVGTGTGAIPANLRRVQGTGDQNSISEDVFTMRERLRGIRALLRESKASTDAATTLIVEALEARFDTLSNQLATASDADFTAIWEAVQETKKLLETKKKETQPMTCGICMDELDEANFMCGKNCYHSFCMTCISTTGMNQLKPSHAVENNRYWEFTGTRVTDRLNLDGSNVVEPTFRLRPEFSDDGYTAKSFPANTWVPCPMCRDPHYADQAYFEVCKRAIDTLDANDEAANQQTPPTDVIQEMRDEEQLLLIQVPNDSTKVMFVEAKIPGVPADPRFPHGPMLGGHLRTAGFQWARDPEVTGGASAWWRNRRFDDVLESPNFRGGQLEKTVPRQKVIEEATGEVDEDGNQLFRRRKVSGGHGSWKFLYPRPAPVENEAGPSATDVVATGPGEE